MSDRSDHLDRLNRPGPPLDDADTPPPPASGALASYPPPEKWNDWCEYEATAWPKKVERRYTLVPTACFNCEASCGLLAYVDRDTLEIRKLEGNPLHPASRGRNCAKGPATLNQVNDRERILYPLARRGARGAGKFERVSWDEVLDDIAPRIRKALVEKRLTEVMYHVGRPGHDGYIDRVLQAWGIDGHNSHTNICSASARLGYQLWTGSDRPSPDHANARFILLLSAHLESGHYFNPHAQRIIEAKMRGAKLACIDPRLSNTASMSDYWLPTYPGTESAVLLAMAKVLLDEGSYDKDFVRDWVNWEEYLRAERPGDEVTFDNFERALCALYAPFTPRFAAEESGIRAQLVVDVAHEIARAGSGFATHVWRGSAAGNLAGWEVARAVQLLSVLAGAVGTEGGTLPNTWNKFKPTPFAVPPPQQAWSELLFPREYPLSHYEMSFLLPHFLKEGRGKLDVYFTRVYNPVWTNPDGFTWMEVLQDESKIGLHAALTPVWNETAWFADYVLPMGLGAERHDVQSQETHNAVWFSFRQPVVRRALERMGKKVTHTYEANPGEVWEEDEFWIELSWRIDPDGTLGVRRWFESPYRKGEKVTIDEYYRWIFENSVPGLPERAAQEGLEPLAYMQKYGAFAVEEKRYEKHRDPVPPAAAASATRRADGVLIAGGKPIGVEIGGKNVIGFPTPSRKLEFFSKTLVDWGWPEHQVPSYTRSHIHRALLDRTRGEFVLVPTFRLPTLIHTRSGNAKWLYEISNRNPLWLHTSDATDLGIATGDLVKVVTEIGYFVLKAWVTEGIAPAVLACSHHLGRWRLAEDAGGDRWSSALARIEPRGESGKLLRYVHGVQPFASDDPDSERIFWEDPGVHQNLAFPVHPDPVSGMHCWHQKVRLAPPGPDDQYGDVFVDTKRSMEVYRAWLAMARPAPGRHGLRRPLWLGRPVRPTEDMFRL
jgi:anaerobic selenocysteine-containing dehydrogenase